MELQAFINEQKGLWETLNTTLLGHKNDIDKVRQAFETFEAERKALKTEMDQLATKFNRPGAGGAAKGDDNVQTKAFLDYARKGIETPELKALQTDDDASGGYRVPINTSNRLIEELQRLDPVMAKAQKETISQGDTIEIDVDPDELTIQHTTERGARSETGTPTMAKETITAHEMYAMPKVTQKMLDDSAFNVEAWLQRKLVRAYEKQLAYDLVLGTGVNQAFGFTTDTRVSHYASTDATHVTIAGLKAQYFALHPTYRARADWMMNSVTMAYLYGLEDGSSRPLIVPDLTQGFGFRLLGRPIVEFPNLPDPGAGVDAVYFGDLGEAYTVLMRQNQTMLRDPYTAKPWILFYTTWRIGGKMVHPSAINKQRCEVS